MYSTLKILHSKSQLYAYFLFSVWKDLNFGNISWKTFFSNVHHRWCLIKLLTCIKNFIKPFYMYVSGNRYLGYYLLKVLCYKLHTIEGFHLYVFQDISLGYHSLRLLFYKFHNYETFHQYVSIEECSRCIPPRIFRNKLQ